MTGEQASAQCYTGPARPSHCELGRSLLEAMPTAAFICDLAGLVIDCNARARALWGEAMREGAAGEDFFLTVPTEALPDTPTESPMARVRSEHQPLRDFETLVQPAQGTPRRAIASVVPLTNDSGELCGVANSFQVLAPLDDSEDVFENGAVGLHVLSADGVITGFAATIDPQRAGLGTSAYVMLTVDQTRWRAMAGDLREIPYVEHIALVGGDFDVLLLVRTPDNATLREVVLNRIQAIEGVRSSRTWLVFDELPGSGVRWIQPHPAGADIRRSGD